MTLTSKRPCGLTGGIASGKSTVARCFETLGATVIDGDRIAAGVLVPGSNALTALSAAFGSSVLMPDGSLNRTEMLRLLIDNPLLMKIQLEILSPCVLPVIDRTVEEAAQRGLHTIIVEAPLLFEYGRTERYGAIITVTAPRNTQIERLMHRSGKSRSWASNVVDLQISLEEKIRRSDYVIDNSKQPDYLVEQVARVFEVIRVRPDLL